MDTMSIYSTGAARLGEMECRRNEQKAERAAREFAAQRRQERADRADRVRFIAAAVLLGAAIAGTACWMEWHDRISAETESVLNASGLMTMPDGRVIRTDEAGNQYFTDETGRAVFTRVITDPDFWLTDAERAEKQRVLDRRPRLYDKTAP